MFTRFKDAMPEVGRPLILAYTTDCDEVDGDKFDSAHLDFGYLDGICMGFEGVMVLSITDANQREAEQLSHLKHLEMLDCGAWAYVTDVLKASKVAEYSRAENVFANGDRPFAATLKGKEFLP